MKKKVENDSFKEEDSYKLKTNAVDKLVNANNGIVEKMSKEDEAKYKKGFLSKIPYWVKALVIKYWFNGACCFFFYWGLGIYIKNQIDLIIVLALGIGVVTDILVNNLFRFIESYQKEYDAFMMFPMKKYYTFFTNIFYALIVLLPVILTYDGINALIIKINNLDPLSVPLGVEPLLFGLLYLIYDVFFITIKNFIVSKMKNKKKGD